MSDSPSTVDLAIIHEWVGTTMEDAQILESWTNHDGDIDATILGLMNWQLSQLLQNPDSVSIEGAIAVGYGSVISALSARIRRFQDQGGVTTTVLKPNVTKMERTQYR